MSSTLKNNAYHILGLDTSASEKDILKRSKEVINRLKADDSLTMIWILGCSKIPDGGRSKRCFATAPSSQKTDQRIFLWFQIADGIDEQVLGLFKLKDYLNAIRVWENASEGQSTKALFIKRISLFCIVLCSPPRITKHIYTVL